LHLNRSASDALICCTIELLKVSPLNALVSRAGPKRRSKEEKEGEQHAEDLSLMDALRSGRKSAFAERINRKNGGLLNESNAISSSKCTAERIDSRP
jgi:hypothetical protein